MPKTGQQHVALFVVLALAGRHNAPATQAPRRSSEASRAVGDSSAFGTALAWASADHLEAQVSLTASASVVLLEIVADGRVAAIHDNVTRYTLAARSYDIGVGIGSFATSGNPAQSDQNLELTAQQKSENGARQPYSGASYASRKPGTFDGSTGPVRPEQRAAEEDSKYQTGYTVLNCNKLNVLSPNSPAPVSAPTAVTSSAPVVLNQPPTRYLVAFASKKSIGVKELNALAISKGNIDSIVQSVGKKLYGNARWSGSYIRW